MELAFQKKFVVCDLWGLNLRISGIFLVGPRNSGESWSGCDFMQKYCHSTGSVLLTDLYHILCRVNGDTCM